MAAPPNLPTTHADGIGELIPAALINDLARAANTLPAFYNVQTYGAKGDGTTDDTAAIQAAIDAALNSAQKTGTVVFPTPALYYKITSTIKVYRSDFAMAHVNLIGMQGGNNGTTLSWQGPTDVNAGGVALFIVENWNFEVRNLNISKPGGAGVRGSSVGLLVSNHISGTGTSGGTFTNVLVSGFSIGIQCGGGPLAAGAASELTFLGCSVSACDAGVYTTGQNTLDIYFINISLGQNTLGAHFNGAQVFVLGGSASGNTKDFQTSGGGTSAISYFRSETCVGVTFDCGSLTTLVSNGIDSVPSGGGPSIIGGGAGLNMIGNRLNGYLQLSGGPLSMVGNEVVAAPVSGDVFDVAGGSGDFAYDVRSNLAFGTNWMFDDRVGFTDKSVSATFAGMLQRLTRSTHQLAVQDLRAVQGISASAIQAKNLCGTVTLATGAAAVSFGVAEVQTVTLTGSPTGGTWRAWTAHNVATTPLAYNITAAALQTALLAIPLLGGVGLVFAAGDIVCSGGPLDVAPIVITFAGARATGPQYLFFTTAALTGGSSPAVSVVRTTPGSFAEIDANYTVQLTGNQTETFKVTAKAGSGFTITSSNGASTASVDWLLIRRS